MNIGFRVDSSNIIGLGHINRAITLAKEFKKKGSKSFFFTSNFYNNYDEKIKKNNFFLKKLNHNQISQKRVNQIFLKKDASKIIKQIKINKISLMIIDNYFINSTWEKIVSRYCTIVLIDDYLQRKTYCDFLISYHLTNREISKFLINKNCKKLTDTQYTIIKNINHKFKKKINYKNVFIYMGGADKYNFFEKIVKKLSLNDFKEFNFTFLINKDKLRSVKKLLPDVKNFKFISTPKRDLYSFAKKNRLIISNMGLSMYEFAHSGSRLILLPQSKIHKNIKNNLKKFKLFEFCAQPEKLTHKIISEGMQESNRKIKLRMNLFDGKGAKNIVNFFLNNLNSQKLHNYENKDKYFLYNLINDPLVRQNSIITKKINFNVHLKWLKKFKKNNLNKMFIFKSNNLKIGQIRLEKEKNFYKLDYSISNEFRNKGLGYKMIKLLLKKNFFKKIKAQVKKDNLASRITLEKLGFRNISFKNNLHNYLYIK